MKVAATMYERIRAASEAAAEHLDAAGAEVAIVLGSGLGAVTERIEQARSAPYATLPGFPETTVAGHPGRVVTGRLANRKVVVLAGRVHGYEGYPPAEVGFGVRMVAALGVRIVVVTNVSGALDPTLQPGEIVALSDHLNLTGASPLTGPNDERLGPRFVDMTDAYSPPLRALVSSVSAAILGAPVREAVYAAVPGPSYETPAEVRMLRQLGAGLVGMSTVHEVITARHAGLDVLGLSLVANHAAGVSARPLRHEDVTAAASAAAPSVGALVAGVVAGMPRSAA